MSKHVFAQTNDVKELKQAFFLKDKKISLDLLQKSTPDYLPLVGEATANKYEYYEKYILAENDHFKKYVEGNSLVITWEGDGNQNRKIPVTVYHQTQVIYNGKIMNHAQLHLSPIATPNLVDQPGQNILKISYQEPRFYRILLIITAISWGCYPCFLLYQLCFSSGKCYLN